MGIGVSIILIAVGLILALAVDVEVSGLDLQTVGWILTVAGLLGLVMTVVVFAPRNRRTYAEERYLREEPLRDDRPRDPRRPYGP